MSHFNELEALAAAGAEFVQVSGHEKRPVGAAWQTRSTSNLDTVGGWLRCGSNVGILLGVGGLIDIEHDDEDGRELLEGLDLPPTVQWASARGAHRLYRLADDLPPRAVVKLGPLEVRLGGRAAQSVLPPSVHPTGVAYRWESPPSAVDIATITLADICVG
jgi:hypothetical protein